MPRRRASAASVTRRISAGSIVEALPDAIALTVLAALPAFLNLATERIFEEEKALLLRASALLAVTALAATRRMSRACLSNAVALTGIAWLAALAISTAFGLAPAEGLLGAYHRAFGLAGWLALAALFTVMCHSTRTAEGRDRLIVALLAGSVWPSAYALLQAAGLDPITWTDTVPGRAGSTAGNPLLMAGYLVAVIPIAALRAWRGGIGYRALLALQVAALVATGSRGPMLALGAAAAVTAVAGLWRAKRVRTAAAVLAVATATVVLVVTVPAARAAVTSRLDTASGSGRVRVLIWDGVRQLLPRDGPRLWLGFGPESLHRVFPNYYVPEIGRIEQTEAMPDRAHNEVLDALVSGGVVGAACLLAFYVAALVAVLRTDDPVLRAALTGATVAHVIEIQLGIATVMSRLAFLAAIAIAAGRRLEQAPEARATQPATRVPWAGLGLAAAAGACSPALSMLMRSASPSAVAPALYGAVLLAAVVVARALAAPVPTVTPPIVSGAALLAAGLACIPLAVTPSRADAFARLGRDLSGAGRHAQAVAAFERAVALQPGQGEFHTALGRALIQDDGADPAGRAARLARARHVLETAQGLNPQDPNGPRNLASVERLEARTMPAGARAPLLERADRLYSQAAGLAPGLPGIWAEWGNVAAERRRFAEAGEKLDRAIALDPERFDPWLLRGHVLMLDGRPADALQAYDRALAIRPGDTGAARARAAAEAAARAVRN